MHARPIARHAVRRAYEQVADQIQTAIVSGSLPPGTRLPLEASLAKDFGVSRATVREALRLLAAQQLIRTVKGPGGGNFVTLPTVDHVSQSVESSLTLLTEAQPISLEEFLEARFLLETQAARFAAERRTACDVQRLYEAIPPEPMELVTREQFALNRDFHAEVLTAARNTLLYLSALPVFTVLQNNLDRAKLGEKVGRAINEQHRELAAVIEAGDADGAEECMGAHLDYLRPAYERAWVNSAAARPLRRS